jgi:O-antigen/teichoic acid export membrane protein
MFIKNSVSYLISKSLAGLILLLSVVVFTRILSPEEFAVYSISISAMNIIYGFFFLWLSLSFTRFYEVYRLDLKALYSSVLFCFIFTAFLLFFLKIFSQKIVFSIFNFEFSYSLFFLVVSFAWYDLNLRIANVNQQTVLYRNIVIYKALIGFLLGLLLYHFFGVNGIFAALIFSSIISPVFLIKSNPLILPFKKVDTTLLNAFFVYGLPLAVTAALTMVVDFSDRFLIYTLLGKQQSGIYSANYDFVLQTLSFLIGIFYLSFFPIINKIFENKNTVLFSKQFSDYANILLIISLPVTAVYVFLADGFSNLFLGKFFRSGSSDLMPIITIGVLIGNLKAYLIDLVFYLRKKTLLQVIPSALIALVNVILNLLWIPRFGLIGSAYATLVSFVLGTLLSAIVAMHYKMLPKLNKDTYKILFAVFIMVLYLLTIRPNSPYDLFDFLLALTSSFLIYFGVVWYFDILKLKQLVSALIIKL